MTQHILARRIAFVLSLSFPLFAFALRAEAVHFFEDAPMSYSSGNCNPSLSNVPDDWAGVRSALLGLGWWTGEFYNGSNAWASDFIEGTDAYGADNANVAIFHGHGNVNSLAFSHSDSNGYCRAGYGNSGGSNIAMGMGAGGQAMLFIPNACCYMMKGSTISISTFGGRQELGYGGLGSQDSNMVSNFYNATGGQGQNWAAWLSNMEDRPGWFTGDNTTVALTRGRTMADVTYYKQTCGLKRATCLLGPGPGNGPTVAWQRDYRDHGCSGCSVCN